MHGVTFLQDLAVVMVVAGVVTLLFLRLKQPVVLGYLLAGFIVGPHTPPFPLIQDEGSIRTMAYLGVVFLMFSMGLEFNLRKLRSVGLAALVVAAFEIACMVFVGYELGALFGWKPGDRLFLGIMLALTSTMIVVKGLRDRGEMDAPHGRLMSGVSLFDDIFVILVMVLLPGFARTGTLPKGELALMLVGLFIFLCMAVVIGLLVVPRLLRFVARLRSDETLLIVALGLCFGVALLAVKLQYSAALGAFLIGAIVAESREAQRVIALTAPLRDMFCAVFFVAIGMLINPAHLAAYAVPVLVVTAVYLVAKIGACAAGALLAGYEARVAMKVGTGMAQIGEFAFVLATLGVDLGVAGGQLYPIIVAAAALNALVRPYLVDNADRIGGALARLVPEKTRLAIRAYGSWVARLQSPRAGGAALKMVRSVSWQIILNVILVTGLFIAAAFVAQHLPDRYAVVPARAGGAKTLCWVVAVFLSLPLVIASVRKWQALSMMMAEIAVTEAAAGARVAAIRAGVSHVLFATGLAAFLVYLVMLSATVLPPWQVLAALVLLVVVAVALFGRVFNRWYTRAKGAIVDVWNQPPPEEPAPARPLPPLLHDADMETFVLGNGPAVGLHIRELALRTRTGASIIAVERGGRSMVNPSPDEELMAGDVVLLMGSVEQLAAARRVLAEPEVGDMELK